MLDHQNHDADGPVQNLPVESLVSVAEERAIASRQVAKTFRKDHKNVLRDIDRLRARMARLNGPMAQNCTMGFIEKRYSHQTDKFRVPRLGLLRADHALEAELGLHGGEGVYICDLPQQSLVSGETHREEREGITANSKKRSSPGAGGSRVALGQ